MTVTLNQLLMCYAIWVIFGAYSSYRATRYGDVFRLKDEHVGFGDIVFFGFFIPFFAGIIAFFVFIAIDEMGFKPIFKNRIRVKNPWYRG